MLMHPLTLTCLGLSADLSSFRPVYAPKDFLEVSSNTIRHLVICEEKNKPLYVSLPLLMQVLVGLRNPNYDSSEDVSSRSHWGLIQAPLNVRDIPQLVRPVLRRVPPTLRLLSGNNKASEKEPTMECSNMFSTLIHHVRCGGALFCTSENALSKPPQENATAFDHKKKKSNDNTPQPSVF